MKTLHKISFLLLILPFCSSAFSQESKEYKDGHGGKIIIPLGDKAFADEIIKYSKGSPAPVASASIPEDALHVPDFDGQMSGFVSLGCGGSLTLKFNDNALINIDGPDLFVFELGKYFEPTDLSISKDGVNWITIGEIDGATAKIDIEKFVQPGDVFNYVRLTDLKNECRGDWPGADIDAVAAIGSAQKVSFSGSVLFNFNESSLKPEAKDILNDLANEIKKTTVNELIVQGYTDNVGTEDFNKKLSLARALSVKNYLKQKLSGRSYKIESQGLGETNPLFPNDTKEDQEKNRRVEIILLPSKK
jgi:outer membrane protein OmpA-like peptidoglycan-associated protein